MEDPFDNGAGEGPCEPGDVIDGGVNCPAGTTLFGGGVEIHAFHGPINDVTPVVGEAPNFTLYFSNAANSPGTGAGNGWVAGAVILNHNETDYYDVAVRQSARPSLTQRGAVRVSRRPRNQRKALLLAARQQTARLAPLELRVVAAA